MVHRERLLKKIIADDEWTKRTHIINAFYFTRWHELYGVLLRFDDSSMHQRNRTAIYFLSKNVNHELI